MAIQFPCSQCKKILSAAEDAVGRPVMCSNCGTVTHVPDPSLFSDPLSPDASSLDASSLDASSLDEDKTSPQYHIEIVQEFEPPVSLRQIEAQTGWAIIVTLCFMPLAIIGMIFGSMAKAEFHEGNYNKAERYYKRAKMWTTLTLLLWVGFFVILTFYYIIPALGSLPK